MQCPHSQHYTDPQDRGQHQAFGFTNPVLIDRQDTIIAGHGRVKAAKLLGMAEVPIIRLESLSPAQVWAYGIADNRLAEDAGWDQEILRIELRHIVLENELDVSLTGFEVPEIDLILGAAERTGRSRGRAAGKAAQGRQHAR